jgi:L-fuconolactonase
MKIIDTHVHVWDLDRAAYPWLEGDPSILNQTWEIGQLENDRIRSGVTAGVLVQAAGNLDDTELMLDTARKTAWIKGVVCWLPLMDTASTQRLLETKFLKDKFFKGVRHQIHDEKDPGWLLQPPVINSLKSLAKQNIPFDVVAVLPSHISTALEVAGLVPGLKMVFDHLSQPPVSSRQHFGEWGKLMKKAAEHENFYAKISGLGTASGNFKDRKTGDVKPYVEFALNEFGVERCFCGGDWPVSILANNYVETWQMYKDILGELLSDNEQEKVFYSNAVRFYDLPDNN